MQTGVISCNCPSWIFQKASAADRKPCKHIARLVKQQEREAERSAIRQSFEGGWRN
jgi:hypothetical protein